MTPFPLTYSGQVELAPTLTTLAEIIVALTVPVFTFVVAQSVGDFKQVVAQIRGKQMLQEPTVVIQQPPPEHQQPPPPPPAPTQASTYPFVAASELLVGEHKLVILCDNILNSPLNITSPVTPSAVFRNTPEPTLTDLN
jgi:hypothetical protein